MKIENIQGGKFYTINYGTYERHFFTLLDMLVYLSGCNSINNQN